MKIKRNGFVQGIFASIFAGVMLIPGCATAPVMNFTAQEKYTLDYLVGSDHPLEEFRSSSGIKYLGVKSRKVYEKYDGAIKKIAEEITRKYELESPKLIVCDSWRFGGICKDDVVALSSENFFFEGRDTPEIGFAFLTHELGHYKYDLCDEQRLFDLFFQLVRQSKVENYEDPFLSELYDPQACFALFYDGDYCSRMVHTFRDGNFIERKEAGHPADGPDELYASAFMIAERGFIDFYKEKFFSHLSEGQRTLVNLIFEGAQKK